MPPMTFPNQRIVTVHRERATTNFLGIKNENWRAAARDLGASPMRAFTSVTLPLIMPGVLSGLLLAFAMSMDDFVISFFITGSNVNPLPLRIYSSVKTGVSLQVNALCTLMLVFVFIVLGFGLIRPDRKEKSEV